MYILPEKKDDDDGHAGPKTYMRMELDDSMFEKVRQQNNDPRLLIKQVIQSQYEELGRSVIDGIEVEGFRTTDPAYGGQVLGDVDIKIWVDAKTWLPVRMDMKIKANEQMEMEGTMYDFQWDVPVSGGGVRPGPAGRLHRRSRGRHQDPAHERRDRHRGSEALCRSARASTRRA